MFGEIPPHIRKRHAKNTPKLGSLDDIDLPLATVRYTEVEIHTERVEPRDAVLDSSAKLDNLTNKALTRLDEVLSDPMTGDPKADAVIMDGIRLVLTTQLRVDDTRLKKKSDDTLAKLLERLEQEDVRLMKTIDA